MVKEINLLYRIQNNLCSYSTLREEEHKSFLLWCGLYIVTAFERAQYEKRKKRVTTVRINLTNTTSAR